MVGQCAVLLLGLAVVAGCGPKRVKRPYNLARYQQNVEWPRPEVMAAAESAWRCGRSTGDFQSPILTVIDYSLPSTDRRMWIIDMPSTSSNGSPSMSIRSAKVPESPSSALQVTYLGVSA